MPRLKLDFEEGKYTLILTDKYDIIAYRYGEHWKEFTGSKLMYLMMQEIHDLREENTKLKEGTK